MVTLTAILVTLTGLTPSGTGALPDYLALRKKHGITQSVGVEALETMVGSRIIEVRGTVKGTFRIGDEHSLLLERSDGDTYVVDCKSLPMWLVGTNVPARLLVNASRQGEYGNLSATLLGAARDGEVAEWEAKQKPKPKSTTGNTRYQPPKSTGQVPTRVLPASEVTPIYASFIKSRNPRLTNAEALRIAQGIIGFSIQYGVDARLIMAMVMVESGFNPNATSRAGAMGLGQLMPGTARGLGVSNAYDTVDNLYGTVKLVRNHLDGYRRKTGQDFDSLVLTLAAYNAGPGAVKRHGGVPPYRETQNYVRKVIGLYYAFLGRT